MQHVRALHQPQKLSGRVTPEFQWERFAAVAHELPPLFVEHWREVERHQDTIPLAIDWDRYYAMDIQGFLRILTVRSDGRLVGYVFVILGPHLHYVTTPWANVDMFWLDPLFRQGWTGVKLFKELTRGVKAAGGKMLLVSAKNDFMDGRVIKLLKRLGFTAVETVMERRL